MASGAGQRGARGRREGAGRPPSRGVAAGALLLLGLALAGCERDPQRWFDEVHADEPFVRRMAVVALGHADPSRARRAVGPLVGAVLRDPDADVRADALRALRRVARHDLGAVVAALGREEFPLVRRAPFAALLVEHGRLAEEALVQAVREREGQGRELAALVLGEIDAVPALVALAQEPSSSVRRAALDGLARAVAVHGSAPARAALEEIAAGERDDELREAARRALDG